MIRIIITILSVLCFAHPYSSHAQQYELGVTGVGTGYMGDINSSDPLYYKNGGAGLFGKYNFNPTWGVRASLKYLRISGSDHDFPNGHHVHRGLVFNNNIKELAITGEFNFFKFIAGRQSNRYTPYLFAGIAALQHAPYAIYQGQKLDLREQPLEINADDELFQFSSWAMSIPVGAGFKYNISGPWSIGAEINYRTVLSDYIDAISQYYRYNTNGLSASHALMADPANRLDERGGTLRGNGKKLDGYMTAGLTLTYTLLSIKCDWWQ